MKNTTYKSIFIAALVISAGNVAAQEFEFDNADIAPIKQVVEPRLKLKFFPGVARPAKNSIAMHMVEVPKDNADILNLSLVSSSNSVTSDQYFDDIQVVDNNLFQLKF